MNIQQIRNKYKSILDDGLINNDRGKKNDIQSEEEQSERQWINIIKQEKHKRILTQSAVVNKQNISRATKDYKQSSVNKKSYSTKLSTEQTIIDLKQKLAQSLLNCSRKDTQIEQFQHVVLRKNEQIKLHQKSITELKKIIEQKDSLLFEQKLHQQKLYKQISQRDKSIQEHKIENQLLKKHIENYAKQLQSTNQRYNLQQRRFDKIEREKQKIDNLKSKIDKLKDDVKRLQFLLSDYEGYAPVMLALEGKHFLGRPSKQAKQLQYWYPDALINGLQKFLKREQIGHGNKVFTQNLVKFIYGMLERSEKTGEKKVKTKYTSRIKQMERKKNHILSVFDSVAFDDSRRLSSTNCRLNTSLLRRATSPLSGNSHLKSRQFSVCLQKSSCSQREKQGISTAKNTANRNSKIVDKRKSFVIQGLEKSLKLNQSHKSLVIMELVESFCKGVMKLFKLDNKMLVQQKVIALCDWLKESVQEIYQTNKAQKEDEYNETGKWKTLGNL